MTPYGFAFPFLLIVVAGLLAVWVLTGLVAR